MTALSLSSTPQARLSGRRRALHALFACAVFSLGPDLGAQDAKGPNTIVFVCGDGSVKSVIAMQWFNKIAAERGLGYRAISRGLSPDMTVPRAIAENLAKDGLPVRGFTPKLFGTSDLGGVARVVAMGVKVTTITQGSGVAVDSWNDVPDPALNYAVARDAIVKRIDALLADLKTPASPNASKGPKRPRS